MGNHTKGKRVSIIIPVYERLELFKICLSSALRQTYKDISILVLDDSETEHIDDYVVTLEDSRIVYHRNSTNLGMDRNYRKMIEISRGLDTDFVFF